MTIKAVVEKVHRGKEKISYPCLRQLTDGTVLYFVNAIGECIVIRSRSSRHNKKVIHKPEYMPSYAIENTFPFTDVLALCNEDDDDTDDES